ncbi:hypothetical protein CP556_11265 [Natrinema sp. CBA1119]|uniref:DUF7344 domain-containing protein n=1 Tax=Natrinema sp. CBA1119 TaxID=1608465 RepID=UPI000BF405FC|nr:hypothetical protein [Natrinema sp. CBA1119]PGF16639.1 hypothetical protein CP556_11265 [Natrinema sp. CBA1119]
MPAPNSAPVVDVERFVRLTNVPLDEAYALLANPRTRLTLHVLSTCEPPLPVDRLTDAVAGRDDADERAVRVSLSHVVLPKLEARDILEYDRETDTVHLERPVVAADDRVAELAGTIESTGTNTSQRRDSAD